jgi:hypothetical protein
MPAIRDRAVLDATRAMVQVSAQLLRILLEGIANLDSKIEEPAHIQIFSFLSRCPERAARWRRACWRRLAPNAIAMAAPRRYRRIVGSRPSWRRAERRSGFISAGPAPSFCGKVSTNGRDTRSRSRRGHAFTTSNSAAEAKTTTRRCAPWLQMDSHPISMLARSSSL